MAKRNSENANPSGSGYVAHLVSTGLLLVTKPLVGTGYIISNAALSRMLFNPGTSRALANAMKNPSAAAFGQVLEKAGMNAQPIAEGATKALTAPGGNQVRDTALRQSGVQ